MTIAGPRFLLVDDHALFRMGLGLMLAERWPQALLTQAGNWAQALDHLRRQPVDLVMLDVHLPDGHGLSDLAALKSAAPQARVLFMSGEVTTELIAQAREVGAEGFIPKSAQAQDILTAVQTLLRGETSFAAVPYATLSALQGHPAGGTSLPEPAMLANEGGPAFSELQLQILRYLGRGTPNKAIARQLGMSESAVRAEVSWITEWLQATSRQEAYERAVARGLLSP